MLLNVPRVKEEMVTKASVLNSMKIEARTSKIIDWISIQ